MGADTNTLSAVAVGNGDKNKILWWIIGFLTMTLTGLGSRHVGNIDRIAGLETKIEVLATKIDNLAEQVHNSSHRKP